MGDTLWGYSKHYGHKTLPPKWYLAGFTEYQHSPLEKKSFRPRGMPAYHDDYLNSVPNNDYTERTQLKETCMSPYGCHKDISWNLRSDRNPFAGLPNREMAFIRQLAPIHPHLAPILRKPGTMRRGPQKQCSLAGTVVRAGQNVVFESRPPPLLGTAGSAGSASAPDIISTLSAALPEAERTSVLSAALPMSELELISQLSSVPPVAELILRKYLKKGFVSESMGMKVSTEQGKPHPQEQGRGSRRDGALLQAGQACVAQPGGHPGQARSRP